MTTGFHGRVRRALADANLQGALDRNAVRRRLGWEAAFDALPDAPAARRAARESRLATLERLDELLPLFLQRLEKNGFQVHRATDASEACAHVIAIARARRARRVAKSKSMLSEEIGLNDALQRAGLEVVETDLGEYIVQLRGEPPSHITAPAIHLRREDVGATFAEKLGVPYTSEVEAITAVARRKLRSAFLEADIGISGVNFGVAESGTLCLVTNEGNGRMVTTLPPVHIALMGLERLVPTLADLARLLLVLPRAATGQVLTSYVSLVGAPRRPEDGEGSVERHVVLVDNGRLQMRDSPLAEALLCIRCGACLNACPVYREIGGHSYGSVYPGPIGSVVSPAVFGLAAFGHLARASTLCGACREACPIDIDLPQLLLRVRADTVRRRQPSRPGWRWAMRLFAWAASSSGRYRMAQRAGSLLSSLLPRREAWIRVLPPPVDAWTNQRDFPSFQRRPFRDRWRRLAEAAQVAAPLGRGGPATLPEPGHRPSPTERLDRFMEAARAAGAEVVRIPRRRLTAQVVDLWAGDRGRRVLVSDREDPLVAEASAALGRAGAELMDPGSPPELESAGAGLTGVEAALADSGSLVLLSGEGRSLLASLMPWLHVAIVGASKVEDSLSDWLDRGGEARLRSASQAVIVTGPSRTADIEMTLTIGVHGPGQLVIILVEDA